MNLPQPALPPLFARWFQGRGWQPRAHQLEVVAKAQAGRDVLLISPTGGGKTLSGFLPSLIELKLASGMTGGVNRMKDLTDVVELIKAIGLSVEFAAERQLMVARPFKAGERRRPRSPPSRSDG